MNTIEDFVCKLFLGKVAIVMICVCLIDANTLRHDQNTGRCLAQNDHVTKILASDWLIRKFAGTWRSLRPRIPL